MERYFSAPIRRYYELELPRAIRYRGRWPALIALHGYQGDKDSMMRVARRIAGHRMVVMSLQGPNQFFVGFEDPQHRRVGFGWGTTWKMEESVARHHADIRILIDVACRRYHADRQRIFLLGFSQACAYNYRYVFAHPGQIHGVVAVCGGVPGDWEENPRGPKTATHILHIAASRDEWYSRDQNLKFQRQLAARARSLDFRFYDSAHQFPRTAIPHIRTWMEKHF